MRKTALICGLLTILLAAACQSPAAETADPGMEPGTAEAESLEENPAENPEKSLEENPYVSAWFSEELSLTVEGRSFLAEDAPENEAEEAVFREWLTEFLQDPKLYLEDCPESRKGLPEVRNTLENYEQGRYQIQEFVLHELEAVSAEEQAEAEVIEVVPCPAEPTVKVTVLCGLPNYPDTVTAVEHYSDAGVMQVFLRVSER